MRWILKHRPEDFRVSECLTLPLKDSARDSRFTYLSLTKSGYTTFEAAAKVAALVGLEPVRIGHAGLKDEDGITQQTLSVPGPVEPQLLTRFNEAHAPRDGRYLRLGLSGWGDAELRAGGLQGNAFELVVRNIAEAELDRVSRYVRCPLLMLNYYDTQRFGVPGGPQTSHLIGRCLLEDRHEQALAYLKESCTPEGTQAQGFQGGAQEFFARLNPKINAFYRSAAASYDWNMALSQALEKVAGGQTRPYHKGCLSVAMPVEQEAAARLLALQPELPYPRYEVRDGAIVSASSTRPSVLQAVLDVSDVARDEFHPEAWRAGVRFLLPAGTYATMVMSHLFVMVEGRPARAQAAGREDLLKAPPGALPCPG